jgi:hypothetical protein
MDPTRPHEVREAPSSRPVFALLGVWLTLALGAGLSGRVAALPPPAPQVLLILLTLWALWVFNRVRALRLWVDTVDSRVLVTLHLTRFVGAYFLVLYGRGELPFAFAIPGGLGDILVAAWALTLLLGVRVDTPAGRRAYRVWNVVGLTDILLVVTTAARIGVAAPAAMAALLRLPLSLLPTFLVPLIIASHVQLFRRLRTANVAA